MTPLPTTEPTYQQSDARLPGWFIAVCFIGAMTILHALRHLLLPFAFAAGAALALDPLVNNLIQRARMPRWAVAVFILIAALAAAAAVGWWSFEKAQPLAQQISNNPSGAIHAFAVQSIGGESVMFFGHQITAQQISDSALAQLEEHLGSHPAALLGKIAIAAATGIVLFFVLLFYFLARGPSLVQSAIKLAPPIHRSRLQRLAQDAYPLLQRYFCGIFIVVAFTSLTTWIFIGPVFHLPCALALSLATGVLEIIPIIGPTASMTLLSAVAIAKGGSLWNLVGFGIFCFGLRFGIDQVVGPVVLGRAVKLPPVVVVFAFLAGGILLGPLGVLIAIPTVALARLTLEDFYANDVD